MRSAVSVILSGTAPEQNMSYPDYQQTPHDHQALLVVVRHIGKQLRTKQFNRAFDRISKINKIRLLDSQSLPRDIYIRYLRGYPSENNEWGDFQTHRKALGLISVGQCNSQEEFNELCRIHESLKVGYAFTLYDSRCILYGMNSNGTLYEAQHSSDVSPCVENSELEFKVPNENVKLNKSGSTGDGVNSRSNSLNSSDHSASGIEAVSKHRSASSDSLHNYLGTSAEDTLDSLSEDSSSKSEAVSASIEYKSMNDVYVINGTSASDKAMLDKGTNSNSKILVTPSNFKARTLFYPTMDLSQDLSKDIEDFISSLFYVLESKRLDKLGVKKADRSLLLSSLCAPFEKKDFVGLDLESKNNKKRAEGRLKKQLGDLSMQAGLLSEAISHYQAAGEILKSVNDWLWLAGALEGMCTASVNCLYPHIGRPQYFHRNASLQGNSTKTRKLNSSNSNSLPFGLENENNKLIIKNCLGNFDIFEKYREAVTHYGKYRQAGIIETEASIKAAIVLTEMKDVLAASEFLQNAVFISLNLTEDEKMQRFNAFSDLYQSLGFRRKASFFKRIAAMRCVSPHNPHPNWSLCHSLLLQLLDGYNLSLDANDANCFGFFGWPRLQIQVLQELVGTAKRKGSSDLATRHLSLLLHTMLPHISTDERRELAQQLENLSKESEGLPIPLALENGIIVPAVHFTNIPTIKVFKPIAPQPHLKAEKIPVKSAAEEASPFVYTPFLPRDRAVKDHSKVDFTWIEDELCEVNVLLENPLPIELKVSSMCLITEGVKFQVNSTAISIPADTSLFTASLSGKPLEFGNLRILGYSTYTLGVKSNVRLKSIKSSVSPHIDVQIVPALPSIEIETSKPKSELFSSFCDSITNSASICLHMGETQECTVTFKNTGKVSIEKLELSLESRLDRKLLSQLLKWDDKAIDKFLPIAPGSSINFAVNVYGAGDFIGTPTECPVVDNSSLSSLPVHTTAVDGPSSLPSRLGAISERLRSKRTESSASRSSAAAKSIIGGGSSVSSFQTKHHKPTFLSTQKNYEAIMQVKYSGGPGHKNGYHRTCALAFNIEIVPSVFITKWDTLPGETPSQCYLVLDLFNTTQQEMEIHYAKSKQMLVEKMESCRVPVPLDRCSTNDIEPGHEISACCSHIVSKVQLKWELPELSGIATLHGITLNQSMAQLVTVSPISWEISLNGMPASTEEMRFESGDMITFTVVIHNDIKEELFNLKLQMRCYQDYQNGKQNVKLDSRVSVIGNDCVLVPRIAAEESFQHSLSVVFFMNGSYKIDFKMIKMGDESSESCWNYTPPLDVLIA